MSKIEKIREVFLDNLPRRIYHGRDCIDWINSVGYKVKFIYYKTKGEVEITKYDSENKNIYIKYKDMDIFEIRLAVFLRCGLGNLLKQESCNFDYYYDETKPRRVDLRELPIEKQGFDWNKVANNKTIIKFVYDDIEGEVIIVAYTKGKLCIEYKNKLFYMNVGSFSKGQLGAILKTNTKDFKVEIGQVFKDDKRDLVIADREYRIKVKNNGSKLNEKYYKYTCNKCGWTEGWVEESSLKRGNGCSCCCGKTIVKGKNDIVTTHPHLVKYFVDINDAYTNTHGSKKKVKVKCLDCEHIFYSSIIQFTKYGFISCPRCGDNISYPNKIMFNILEQLELDFTSEYSPDWIGKKRYDFYIPSRGIIIEMDGRFHYKDNYKSLKETQDSDSYKDKLAIEHKLKVIRINCDYDTNPLEYIKPNILNSELSVIFDLSNINWSEVDKNASSSLVKQVCEYKRNNINIFANDIGKIFNISQCTVIKYLKRGTLLNWCHYDTKEERKRNVQNFVNRNKAS